MEAILYFLIDFKMRSSSLQFSHVSFFIRFIFLVLNSSTPRIIESKKRIRRRKRRKRKRKKESNFCKSPRCHADHCLCRHKKIMDLILLTFCAFIKQKKSMCLKNLIFFLLLQCLHRTKTLPRPTQITIAKVMICFGGYDSKRTPTICYFSGKQ